MGRPQSVPAKIKTPFACTVYIGSYEKRVNGDCGYSRKAKTAFNWA
jgi:hypothetical protein